MNRLKPLSHSQLTASQLQFVAIQSMAITEPLLESDLFIKKQHDEMSESNDTMEKIYAHSKINEKAAAHASADENKDSILLGIRNYLKGLIGLEAFEPEKAQAAKKILSHMESFGSPLYYGGYEKQAALVAAFLTSMKSEEFTPLVEAAGIGHLITALDSAHIEVNALYQEKIKETNKPNSTLTEEKKKLQYRINGLLTYLDVNISDGATAFVPLENALNLLITDVMSQYRAKQTRKEHSEEAEQDQVSE